MFPCHECGLQFLHIEALNNHIRNQHNNYLNQFVCQNCFKKFNHQRSLTRHIRDKTCLKCKFCKKTFDNKDLLEQHRGTHFENIHESKNKEKYFCPLSSRPILD